MTATMSPELKATSRRALLAGAIGGLGALAASAIGRSELVRATEGDVIHAGDELTATSVTQLTTTTAIAIKGLSDSNWGVVGGSNTQIGVYGISGTSVGVFGESAAILGAASVGHATSDGTGVHGYSNSEGGGVPEAKLKTGVYGYANQDGGATGVWGESILGTGVFGSSNSNYGVVGASNLRSAVLGWGSTTGVQGVSGETVVPTAKAKTGVYGYAGQDSAARGVLGETTSGHGVHGTATSGYAGYFDGKVYSTKWYELTEISTPGTPTNSRARLFIRDHSGHTQLCVKFGNGQVKVIVGET